MVFFFPETIATEQSEINGEIKVIKLMGTNRLIAGGYTQSGGLMRTIWESALKNVRKSSRWKKPDILILGLGGGSAAEIVAKLWQGATIEGVEIDPIIIRLAKAHLSLKTIPKLTVIRADAIDWLKRNKSRKHYRLVLVDLYLGGTPPPAARKEPFLQDVSDILTEDGVGIFNHLIKAGEKWEIEDLKQKLTSTFAQVNRLATPANAVFAASKKSVR